jgi:DNA-binding SARP family transcriptional activator/tetratricopeptide (TPR) repeat protein
MDFRLLGPLEVRSEDGPLPLGGAKQRTLLALLLLNANRVVARDRLIQELWGDDAPESAVTAVQVYVSRLRKLLPSGRLETRPPGYLLRVEPAELDLDRFERLRAAGRLRDALELWRGPAVSELPFEHARLEDLRLAVLEERLEHDLQDGRAAELVGELELLVAGEPHREGLRALLMLALYRSGRQTEALAAYRTARAALAELGIEPSERLRALERGILTHELALDASPAQSPQQRDTPLLPGPLAPVSPFPFVGRGHELSVFREALTRAEDGEGGMVLLTGEPGAGKTRLMREVAHEAAGRGAVVLYGVSDAVVSTPYQPLREWFELLLRVWGDEELTTAVGRDGGRLVRLVPELAELGFSDDEATDAEADRYLFQSVAIRVLKTLSRGRPLLALVDDLHWADHETLTFLRRLARAAPEMRVLVAAAYRDPGEEISPQLRDALVDLSRLDAVRRLALTGLTRDEVAELIEASADAEATPELASAISELTDGSALLVCELWRDLRESGALERSADGLQLSRPAAELRGPRRIHESVQQRLSRLSPETRGMIELAAVVGPRFELAVVGAAAGFERATLTDAVLQASRHGIVEELPTPAPTCRFTHELIRRAVYDPIPRLRLPELHLRVAEALEAAHAAELARVLPELAHHFTIAAPLAGVERAAQYNLRAAAADSGAGAYREAIAKLSTALELGLSDPREEARVQAELGHLYFESGRVAESDAALSASLEAATALGERALAARALVQRSNQRLASDPDISSAEIVPIAEEAVRTFEELADRHGLAAAEHLLGHALGREGRSAESDAALERALAHADAVGDLVARRHIIGRLGRRLGEGPTPVGTVIERLEALRASASADLVLDAGLRAHLANALSMACRFAEAREHIAVCTAVLDQADRTDLSLSARWNIAEALEFAGDPAAAEEEFVAAFMSMRDARGAEPEARALRTAGELALLLCDQGRWEEAVEYLAYGEHIDRPEPVRGKLYSLFRFAAKGRLAAQRGDFDEALDLVGRAVAAGDRSSWLNHRARLWLVLAEVNRSADRAAEADAAAATALALYDAKGNLAAAAQVRDRLR